MWLFTEIADGFDRMVHENEAFLETVGTDLAADYLKTDSTIDAVKLGGFGILHAIHTFSTTFSRAYADTLRIGDGVSKGGWGYGEDALRALIVAGPALRVVRTVASSAKGIDLFIRAPSCTWVASTQALRLTGTRLFARLSDLSRASNVPIVATLSARRVHELTPALRRLGAGVKDLGSLRQPAFQSMQEVVELAKKSREGVVMFSVKWMMKNANGQAQEVGHTLLGRYGTSGFRILDRTGKVAKDLKDLEKLVPGYTGISQAVPYGSAAIIENAKLVKTLGSAAWPLGGVAVQVMPVLLKRLPPPAPQAKNGTQAKSGAQPKSGAQGKGTQGPGKPATAGLLKKHQFCFAPNNESPASCSTYYTYIVVAGDYLSLISQKVYGNATHWRIIYQANKDLLGPNPHSPAALKVGMELFIPSSR